MANFIGLVYATLKEKGIDTSKMSTDEAVAKFKELQGEGKEEKKDTPEDVKKKLNGEEIKAENVKKGETSEDVNKRYNAYKEQNKHYLEEIKKGLGGEKPNQVQVRKAVQHLIEQKGELNGWDANMIKDELGADTTQVQNAFSYMQFNKNKKEEPSEIKDKLNGKKSDKIIDKLDNRTFRDAYHFLDWVGYQTDENFKWSNNRDGSMTIKAFGNEYNVEFNLNENRENPKDKYQVKITKVN